MNHKPEREPTPAVSAKDLAEDYQMSVAAKRETIVRNQDHADALHAVRVARRMGPRVIHMLKEGSHTQYTKIGPKGLLPSAREVDSRSATLALNAELRQQGLAVTAELYHEDWSHTLAITHIGDTEVQQPRLGEVEARQIQDAISNAELEGLIPGKGIRFGE